MIFALLLGREGSAGFPGKNIYPILGRPLMIYPMMAAENSKYIDECYLSTDSEKYKAIGRSHGWDIIDRPPELATKEALGEDAFVHGYKVVKELFDGEIELIVLLFCNAATIVPGIIDIGIEILRKHPEYDSVVTASCYNMWSPLRARKIDKNGVLTPFVPFEVFGDPKTLNCDRDSQGNVWFADMGLSIVRPKCLENIDEGLLPQKWMGRNIYPLIQWGGCDIDYKWQIPGVEFWLNEHGFTETKTPYDFDESHD